MPELPETETIARDLDAMVRDAVVAAVSVRKADVLRECDPELLASSLVGNRVVRVWRRAKLVVLDFATSAREDDRGESVGYQRAREPQAATAHHLVIQPRFTGGLLLDDGSLPASELAYVAVTLRLRDARLLHYRDVRRLGTVALMSPERFGQYSGDLGVEPLDLALSNAEFSALVRS